MKRWIYIPIFQPFKNIVTFFLVNCPTYSFLNFGQVQREINIRKNKISYV